MAARHKSLAAGILFLVLIGLVHGAVEFPAMLCSDPLGMESGAIPNENLKSSSSYKKEEDETHSRLNTGGVWVAKTEKVGGDEWLGITFGDVPAIITAVATQGRSGHPASWVTKYKLQYLDESDKLVYYDKELAGNTDQNTVVRHELKPALETKEIRFVLMAFHRSPSMRVEVYGCRGYWRQFCPSVKALGMQSKKIPKEDIKTSTEYKPEEGGRAARLHRKAWFGIGGGWVPSSSDQAGSQQWLQVDFEKVPAIITHVATQGRDARDAWVKKYKLQYLDDSNELVNFRAEGAKTNFTEFLGNKDRHTVVTHELITNPALLTKGIRFLPTDWHDYIGMRLELYGCRDTDECANASLNTCPKKKGIACVNEISGHKDSYHCACAQGYKSTDSSKVKGHDITCEDIDECADPSLNTCGKDAKCENSAGGYYCTCALGFQSTDSGKNNGKDITCEDVDECAHSQLNKCGKYTKCKNNVGSYECMCESGFESASGENQEDYINCADIDECKDPSIHKCTGPTKCVNQLGSHSCTCALGYEPAVAGQTRGLGIKCKDVNECKKKACHPNATCTNTNGSYKCKCKPGWKGDGKRCTKPLLVASGMSLQSPVQSPVMLLASALLGCLAFF